MVHCFAADCNHNNERETCSMFRFPFSNPRLLNKWIEMCKRDDCRPTQSSRLCNCHFKRVDGIREEVPSIFNYNSGKTFNFESPEKRKRRKRTPKPKTAAAEEKEATLSPEQAEICTLKASKACLEMEISELKVEIDKLQKELTTAVTTFSFNSVKDDDALVNHYTGLPTAEVFNMIVALCCRFEINYYDNWRVECMPTSDQIFMCLLKLRRNYSHTDLAVRFKVSNSTVKSVVLTWLHVLHEVLYEGIIKAKGIPSQMKNSASSPSCFSTFTNCRVVFDCTEIETAVPRSSMFAQSNTFSHYKQRNTLKGLVGVAPNGAITFISDLYPGSLSDKEIVSHCQVLRQMNPGDLILADKGFLVRDMLPQGVNLNIPPFLSYGQFTKEQAVQTTRIARARIHVERAMEKIKNYLILDFVPVHYRSVASKIFQVCACLVNFQNPMLKEIEQFLV